MVKHVKLVRAVLKKLCATQLYAKLSKCEFHKDKINYLGYCISHEGIEMYTKNVQTLLEWAPPHTRKQYQSSLEFANFYCQFILSFSQIALPITSLLKIKGEGKPKPSLLVPTRTLPFQKEGEACWGIEDVSTLL